ncbi:class I SAM-dependent methyltransferase [Luedemannella helvata]|uniref:Methyltransferase type 11 domain-containing protein n=1 Tax=Luedemannella helvata TaxID=349315 RepID=A0ABP4WUE4_9ACTN
MDAASSSAQRRFDQWAPTYDDGPLQPVYRSAHRGVVGLLATVRAPGRLLDLGCGTGRLLRAVGRALPHAALVGVDRSATMLAIARRTAPGAAFVHAHAERLPFEDAAFDVVTATFAARHWAAPRDALHHIRRVLAGGGAAIIADCLDRGPRRRGPRLDPGRCLPPPWDTLLAQSGLRVRSVEYVEGHGPVPTITLIVAIAPSS